MGDIKQKKLRPFGHRFKKFKLNMSVAIELARQFLDRDSRESFALESLAWHSGDFRKAFDELSDKTGTLFEVEEHGTFLKKCIELHLMPRKDQLFKNLRLSHKNISYVDLLIAEKESEKRLHELETDYRKTFMSIFGQLVTSFKKVLLIHILKKARSSRHQIKWKYICEMNTLRGFKDVAVPQFPQTRSKNASTSSEYPKSSSSENDSGKCSPKTLWSVKANKCLANRDKVEHLQSKVESTMFSRLTKAAQRKETAEADKLSANMDKLSLIEKS